MGMYFYVFKPQAFNEFKKLPREVQTRILEKLDYFVTTPTPLAFADRLINYEIGTYRFRVGDYRVIFDLEGHQIVILSLGHRREIYK